MSNWGVPFKIREIKSWPPGSMMQYYVMQDDPDAGEETALFYALGIVIANDGNDSITVMWSPHCHEKFSTYSVHGLNGAVISRVR